MMTHVDDLSSLCDQLRRVPREATDYGLVDEAARTQFGVGDPELEALRNAGLHGTSVAGEPTYAGFDLHYIGLRRRCATDVLAGIQLWRSSLERLTAAGETEIKITYIPKVPDATDEAVHGVAVLPGATDQPVALRHLTPAAAFTTTQRASWPVLPDDARLILEDVARFELCLLPARFAGDLELARELRLVDCWTGAMLVVDGCRRIGRRARLASGLMVVLPFSMPHTWAEVDVDGIWTPVDPINMTMMQRWAGLDPDVWPHHRSPGAMLAPLVWDLPAPVPLVSRDGRSVPMTLVTKIVTGQRPAG